MARINDTEWVRGMFGLSPFVRGTRMEGRYSTTAEFKFSDTTLGGNAAINSYYQFTKYADIPSAGLLARPLSEIGTSSWLQNEKNTGSTRMGRVYSEVFDDNANLLYLRFGQPRHTGTLAFLSNMYDLDAARLAKFGEYTLAFRAGQVFGLWAMFMVVPWQVLIPVILTAKTLAHFMGSKPSKYYYLNPRQDLYLQSVQNLVDTQAIYWKMLPITEAFGMDRIEDITESDMASTMEEISKGMPDIWKSNYKIDVFKMVTRYQTLANYQSAMINKITDDAIVAGRDSNQAIADYIQRIKQRGRFDGDAPDVDRFKMNNLMKAYSANKFYGAITTAEEDAKWEKEKAEMEGRAAGIIAAGAANGETNTDQFGVGGTTADMSQTEMGAGGVKTDYDNSGNITGSKLNTPEQTNRDFWSKAGDSVLNFVGNSMEQAASEARDGAQWIVFRVDGRGSVNETFSNSTSVPEISQTVNGFSATARTIDFNTSGGKTGIDLVDAALQGVKDFAAGGISALHMTGLLAVAGGSVVDFPEKWESSQAQFGSQSYTIRLGGPYGNVFSLFQDIAIPLCFLLAGTLPLSTGKQSYVSPFLVEAYCPGHQVTRLGIIESMSITRGVGNMPWRPDGKALAVDVTFTIRDLSTIVHMPIVRNTGWFDEASKFSDYMALLGGATLQDMTYQLNRATLNFNIWKQSWKSRFMSGRITNDVMNTAPLRAVTALMNGRTIVGKTSRPN